MKTYTLVSIGLLSAIAAIFQVTHGIIGIQTGFGMTVDLVGVPILLAFFLFGLEGALYTSVIVAIIITLIAPTTWLGASMKFAATVPMFLAPAYYLFLRDKKYPLLSTFLLGTMSILTIFILSLYVNIFSVPIITNELLLGILPILFIGLLAYALIVIWRRLKFNFNPHAFEDKKTVLLVFALAVLVRGIAMLISNYYYAGPLFFHMTTEQMLAAIPWYLIFGWNLIQGAIEFSIAWAIAYKFKFVEKYAD